MMGIDRFPGRVALQQRVLPAYRAAFFDILAEACDCGLSVFAGQPLPQEHIAVSENLHAAHYAAARNYHFTHPGSPFYYCWQSGLLAWLKEWQPDALIVEATPRCLSTRRAVRWMHARNRPVLGWGLGAPPLGGPLASWRGRARRRFLSTLDGLIAYSQRGASEYQGQGVAAGRIFVAPNAAAARPDRPLPARPPGFVERPSVLFVGRLQARKRVDNLLQACAALPESLQPRLWVVGDGPARQELQSLATQVYPPAHFTGALHGPDLEGFFASADLFVLPGTGGLAVQQAMSFGLPVIVAQGDGTQDDLVSAGNGWLIPQDDLAALTAAMQDALADPARLRRMGAASYHLVAGQINLENMAAVFVQALSSATSEPGKVVD